MKNFDYTRVLFTDEKSFYLTFVPQGSCAKAGDHPEQEVPKWPKKIHAWGAVGSYFKTKLYFFKENMNVELYQEVLRTRLIDDDLIFAPDCPQDLRQSWHFLQEARHIQPCPLRLF